MVNGKSANGTIVRTGYVRSQWKFPAETQKRILLQAGVPEKRILVYDEWEGVTLEIALEMLRGDEMLETAGGFRALGGGRFTITGEYRKIKAAGKVLVDCETGMRSDRDGVEMLSAALAAIHGQRTAPNHDEAVQRGKSGAEARWRALRDKRLPLFEARAIWLSRKIRTNAKALNKMPGWTARSAYKEFGPSGRPAGNPGGSRKT